MRLFVAIFLAFLLSFTVRAEFCPQSFCVTIIDASAMSLRVHIYSYDLQNKTPINIHEIWVKKQKIGLASLAVEQDQTNRYLSKLFLGIPKAYPVYFYGRGEVRLISRLKQQKIYDFIKNWFNVEKTWQLRELRTLTGSEEGVYAWLALNYLLGNFKVDRAQVGILDLGRVSVQIVFPLKNDENAASSEIINLTLYGKAYKVYSRSFLGLGDREVLHQFLESKDCFSHDYLLPTGKGATGSAYACETEIATLINSVHKVNNTLTEVLSDNPQKSWYITGGLISLVSNELINLKQNFTIQEVLDKAHTKICQESWTILTASYPKNEVLYSLCLASAYYYALLTKGFGIHAETNLNFLSTSTTIDWTLGAVLDLPKM